MNSSPVMVSFWYRYWASSSSLARFSVRMRMAFFVLGLDQIYHLLIDLALGLGTAGQRGIAAQILVVHGLQRHHVKFIAHAVAGQHGAGKFGGLLDIVRLAGGDRIEGYLLGGAAAGQGSDLVSSSALFIR